MQLALDELVADRSARAWTDVRAFEAIAFGAHLGHVAQLACNLTAQCAHAVKLIIEGLDGAHQPAALGGVGIVIASEAPMRLWQCSEPLGLALALG